MTVTFIPRPMWDDFTLPRKGHVIPTARVRGLAIHHTVFTMGDWDRDGIINGDLDDIVVYMRRLQRSRPDLGLDVPYSFVVFPGRTPTDGIVVEGRGLGRTGAHTAGHNSTRYGVAFAGNQEHQPVTDGMVAAVRWVGERLADPVGAWAPILHRDVKATACPGRNAVVRRSEFGPPYIAAPDIEEDDPMWIARTTDDQGRQRNALVSGVFRTEFTSNATMSEAAKLGAPVREVSWEFFSRQLVDARTP